MDTFDARKLRKTVLDMAYAGSTVHIGCAFSIIEIMAVLYRSFVRYPDSNPSHPDRDYLVLSKGHGVMAQYACMRELGWLPETAFTNYFADGSELKGLSDSRIRGLEVTSGSLGHGFSVGVGMALAAKLKNSEQRTFIIVGDGELNEGPIWEGAMFAAHHQLKNLVVIVDENGFQAMGKTTEVIGLGSVKSKFDGFGFEAVDVDGHNEATLSQCLESMLNNSDPRPKAIVARTVKGKGVSFMENNNIWHYTRLNADTHAAAIAEVTGAIQ